MGYLAFTETDGKHKEMLMDIGVFHFSKNETHEFMEPEKESAFLILSGKIELQWAGGVKEMERNSLLDENPFCLHVPKQTRVIISGFTESEILIQKTVNSKSFEPVFYDREMVSQIVLCDELMRGTARRILRDIFDYSNAPYSNMVMGEVITFPGKWSSYPPHHHPQPEVYYYRFDKPQGFGVSIIGDQASVVTDNSISCIPGGLTHPQAAAPGYAMYYCWMIRHLENNPWVSRIDDESHKWLYDNKASIWEGKK